MSQDHGDQLDQQLLFEVIENQLADGYPLKVKATLMRLCMIGHSRDDALELIACALAPEMFAVVELAQEFNLPRYEAHLDLLPQTALKGKTVLPLATGGSPHHMLALDYALRPVLQSLGARHILPGVYASDAQIPKDEAGDYQIGGEIAQRLDDATHTLLQEGLRLSAVPVSRPVPFSQALYSV